MKIEEKDSYQIKTSTPETKLDTSVAFLQVPTKLKDRVKAYIDEIADENDKEKMASDVAKSPLQSNGCFFVISLDQIVNIHSMLEKALDPKQTDIDDIRIEVRKALDALQGQ